MLGDISSGFSTSTTETYIFLAILGAIFLSFLLFQGLRKRSQKKAAEERRKNPQKPILRTYTHSRRDLITLSSREQRTLDHLAWFLKDPSRQDKLKEDDALLVKASRKGIREGIVGEAEVLRLLNKLEVDSEALTQGRRDTASIPTGAETSISDRNLNMAVGELLLGNDKGLSVRIDKGVQTFPVGTHVEVVCNSNEGMYRFHSTVQKRDGKTVWLQHSKHVEHVQRRKYRRREAELPVEITIPGISLKPIRTKTIDISIGGTALKNPRKRIGVGTRLDCTIDSRGAAPLTVPGTALRTSKRGKVVHVTFSSIDDKTRHRLFRKLIRIGTPE